MSRMMNRARKFTMVHARWTVAGLGIASCLLIMALLSRYLQHSAAGIFLLPAALFCIALLFISNRHFAPPRLVFIALGGLTGCVGIPLIVYHDCYIAVLASGAWRFNAPSGRYGLEFVEQDAIGFGLLIFAWPFVICILAGFGFILGKILFSIPCK